jgi:S-adenosylmethionine synthetase
LYVNTYGTSKVEISDGEIAKRISKIFDMRPYFIEQRFNLRTPIYAETAAYGHMGREPKIVEKIFNKGKKNELKLKVELFPWEKLDHVDQVKKAFKIA